MVTAGPVLHPRASRSGRHRRHAATVLGGQRHEPRQHAHRPPAANAHRSLLTATMRPITAAPAAKATSKNTVMLATANARSASAALLTTKASSAGKFSAIPAENTMTPQ